MHPEGHDKLALLENVILARDRGNRARFAHGVRGRIWADTLSELLILPVALPLAIPLLFIGGGWQPLSREVHPWFTVITWFLCMVGLVVLAIYLARWRRVRLRDRMGAILSGLYGGCGAVSLWFIHAGIEDYDRAAAWIVVPVWLFFGLSLTSLVVQRRSPRTEAWDTHFGRGPLRSDDRRIDVRRIHPEDQAMLLADRNAGIRILAERGLIDAADVDELVARPLGTLHLPLRRFPRRAGGMRGMLPQHRRDRGSG